MDEQKKPVYNGPPKRMLTAFGETKSLFEWSRERKLSRSTIANRLDHGWTPEDAVSKPPQNDNTKSQKATGKGNVGREIKDDIMVLLHKAIKRFGRDKFINRVVEDMDSDLGKAFKTYFIPNLPKDVPSVEVQKAATIRIAIEGHQVSAIEPIQEIEMLPEENAGS